jgi:chitinase domain-containing protein 1
LVLEAWQQWDAIGGFRDAGFTQAVLSFVRELGARLKSAGGRVLLLAVPPALPAAPGWPAADVGILAGLVREGAVAGLSVMTYDHLTGPGPGPVAPLDWQRKNLELLIRGRVGASGGKRGKKGDEDAAETVPAAAVMLGVNFYGYRFSTPAVKAKGSAAGASGWQPEAVTSGAFLAALARFKPVLAWDAAAAEHKIKYKEAGRKNVVYYPTPAGIAARAALAEEFGAGLSIWELGQGYEALFDLL